MMVHLLCELKREPEVFDQSFLSYLFTSVVLTYKLLCISYSGIYYGTSATVPMMGRNGIGSTFDAGMLTYESLTKQDKGSGKGMLSTTSFSLGLTRHHFVTLSSVNDVKFVNRVAKKVIQEEPRSYRKNESTWYLSPQLRKLGLMCSGMRGCCSGSEEE